MGTGGRDALGKTTESTGHISLRVRVDMGFFRRRSPHLHRKHIRQPLRRIAKDSRRAGKGLGIASAERLLAWHLRWKRSSLTEKGYWKPYSPTASDFYSRKTKGFRKRRASERLVKGLLVVSQRACEGLPKNQRSCLLLSSVKLLQIVKLSCCSSSKWRRMQRSSLAFSLTTYRKRYVIIAIAPVPVIARMLCCHCPRAMLPNS
jgi:hypothetical protein